MLKKFVIIAALAMTAVGVGAEEFRTVARAYETLLSDLRLPISPSGTVGIRNCGSCKEGPLRVSVSTVYRVNGTAVDLREFRRLALQVRDRNQAFVTVKLDLASDTVTEVSLSVPEAG